MDDRGYAVRIKRGIDVGDEICIWCQCQFTDDLCLSLQARFKDCLHDCFLAVEIVVEVPWTHSRHRAYVADTGAPEAISLEAYLRGRQDAPALFIIFGLINLSHRFSPRLEHSLCVLSLKYVYKIEQLIRGFGQQFWSR